MSSTGEEDWPSAEVNTADGSGVSAAAHSDDAAQDSTDSGYRAMPQQIPQRPQGPPDPKEEALNNPLLEYDMNHKKRGYCLIFNQMNFDKRGTLVTRKGSDVDTIGLKASFETLGFVVQTFKDLTSADLIQVLDEYSKITDHSDCDCFALVLLSSLGDAEKFYIFDEQLPIDTVTKPFRPDVCKTLAGKPKLFFFQAFRGYEFMRGCEVADGPSDEADPISAPNAQARSVRMPLEADFCFFYSTPPGNFSWRNSVEGSCFVQQLAAVLKIHGNDLEFQQVMQLVQHKVATYYESHTRGFETDGMKQMPVVVSQLRKLLYFRDK